MPQVSVIPAKTRPAPTNADRPRKAGWTNAPERRAEQDQRPGGDPHLPLQRDRLLAPDDGQPGSLPGQRAALDVDDVGEAGGEELLARLPARLPERQMTYSGSSFVPLRASITASGSSGPAAQSRGLGVDLPVLDRGPHVDQLDRDSPAANPQAPSA